MLDSIYKILSNLVKTKFDSEIDKFIDKIKNFVNKKDKIIISWKQTNEAITYTFEDNIEKDLDSFKKELSIHLKKNKNIILLIKSIRCESVNNTPLTYIRAYRLMLISSEFIEIPVDTIDLYHAYKNKNNAINKDLACTELDMMNTVFCGKEDSLPGWVKL